MKKGMVFLLLMWISGLAYGDIYVVIYTTKDGHTGHVGLAWDNYRIYIDDVEKNGEMIVVYDTVKAHSLSYTDLWGPAEMDLTQHDTNLEPRYYNLPRASSEPRITPDVFLTSGLPHAYEYPCDALIRIKTSPGQDYKLKEIVYQLQKEHDYFNTRRWNCSDYVLKSLNELLNTTLEAKEYIPFTWSSTPNMLYKTLLAELENVEVLKAAGTEIYSSFVKERIVNTVLNNRFFQDENNH